MRATGRYIEAVITALSVETGIKFVDGDEWTTDIVKRVITYNGFTMRQLDIADVKGYLLHEVGHILHTKVEKPSDLLKKYPAMQHIYNVAEDMRVNDQILSKYGDFAREAFYNRFSWDLLDHEEYFEDPENSAKVSDLNKVLLMWMTDMIEDRGLTDKGYVFDRVRHEDHFERAKEYYEKLYDKMPSYDYASKILKCKDTDAVIKFVDKHVYPILKDLIEEDSKKMQDGSGTVDQRGICETDQDGKDKGEGLGKGEEASKEPTEADHLSKDNGHGPTIRTHEDEYENHEIPEDWELDALTSHYSRVLTQRIGDILKEKATTRFSGSKKRGKLLAKNTYKILTDDKRPFSKRSTPDKPDYHITFILDESGSMEGAKHAATYIASYMLDKVAHNLNFKVTYVGYDDRHRVYENLAGYRKIHGGGNEDEHVINEVSKKLDYSEDNLIFMMTDGGVCSRPRKAIEALGKKGVPLIAVGVGISENETRVMKEHYPDYVSAPHLDDLPATLVLQMKRLIHR